MKTIHQIFPRGSKTFHELNPQYVPYPEPENALQGNLVRRRGTMNKTEAEYALILEAMKRKGEILRYEYEGITLRWAGVRYTPDFVVFGNFADQARHTGITLIEVKGAWTKGKFARAVERFRHARTYWVEFAFELHQKTRDGWKRVE